MDHVGYSDSCPDYLMHLPFSAFSLHLVIYSYKIRHILPYLHQPSATLAPLARGGHGLKGIIIL